LVVAYNKSTIDYKSKSLVQSIAFMSQRLAPLSSELDSIESGLAEFKESRRIVGNSAAGQLYLTQTAELDATANSIRLQREMLDAVDRYINNPATNEGNLSVVGLNDSYITGLVTQYQQLRAEREKLALSVTPENPKMQVLERQIIQTRQNINEQIKNLRYSVEIQQRGINQQPKRFCWKNSGSRKSSRVCSFYF
jgi:uncharacterized protein involved in exopolysaccharide biosynthesis